MTREEFINNSEAIYCSSKHGPESCFQYKYLMEQINDEKYSIKNIVKIDAFLKEFSEMCVTMKSENKHDFKSIRFMVITCDIIYINENNVPALHVAEIWNSSQKMNKFYMSEAGDFYNSEKIKIADNTDDFLEYILSFKCDEHEPISEETYSILRSFGWYEGRRIDISHPIEECEKRGVFFTDIQKEIISEFAGITGKDNYGYYYLFNCEEDNDFLRTKIINGAQAVYLGFGCTMVPLYLTGDGILFRDTGLQFGLDIMEGLQIMFNQKKNK